MKNIHLQFLPSYQSLFIKQAILASNLSIKELGNELGISSRTIRDWKREKTRISLLVAEKLISKYNLELPEKKEILIERYKNSVSNANKKGGIARYKKYGEFATLEGRSKGGKKALAILRAKGIIKYQNNYNLPKLNVLLAEFVGIMLGDGGMTTEQLTITLNSEADSEYIKYVSNLSMKLFGVAPKMYKYKDEKTTRLYYYGISLVNYFNKMGLVIGSKVRQQASIPAWIYKNREYKKACLRGLIDTDGGIFIHKYNVNKKEYSYAKIAFTNRSLPILQFVFLTLKELGFSPKILDKIVNKKVWLYNSREVEKYLNIVGSSNNRLTKFRESGPDGKAQVC